MHSTTERELITLSAGNSLVQLCPSLGGVITRYADDDGAGGLCREWLRPASTADIAMAEPRGMACFPLLPYSSRIREGCFSFAGQTITLPLNFLPQRHSIHGQAWQNPWRPLQLSTTTAVLEYQHQADQWPWSYRAQQTFALTEERLQIDIEVENLASEPMPAGIGLHPYFVRTALAKVTAACDQIWLNDAEVMPFQRLTPSADKDLRQGVLLDKVELDNTYTGWQGEALIEWPEWQAQLCIKASPVLKFLVVFAPAGESFFCVEPVSNITDAFNKAAQGEADTGMQVLSAGECLSATVTLSPQAQPLAC